MVPNLYHVTQGAQARQASTVLPALSCPLGLNRRLVLPWESQTGYEKKSGIQRLGRYFNKRGAPWHSGRFS